MEFVPFEEFGDDVHDFGVDMVGQSGGRGAAEFEFPRAGIGFGACKDGALALAFAAYWIVVYNPFIGLCRVFADGHKNIPAVPVKTIIIPSAAMYLYLMYLVFSYRLSPISNNFNGLLLKRYVVFGTPWSCTTKPRQFPLFIINNKFPGMLSYPSKPLEVRFLL